MAQSRGEEVLVFGDGSAARDFIYVGDVAEFFIKAIQKKNIKNEVVNLGTGKPTTIKEIIELCGEVTGKTPKLVYKNARLGEIANLFGEVPKTSIKEGLEKTYEWFKQNKMEF